MELFAESITLDGARQALRDYSRQARTDPRSNSVFKLGHRIFSAMENGKCSMSDLEGLIWQLHEKLAWRRALTLRGRHGLDADPPPFDSLILHLEQTSCESLEIFQRNIDKLSHIGLVFTAHPTFAASPALRRALGLCASSPDEAHRASLAEAVRNEHSGQQITLNAEHEETQTALCNARRALGELARSIISIARTRFPEHWRQLVVNLPKLASWVGYDLDGRTDIAWYQSVSLRLSEKLNQLEYYANSLAGIEKRHDCSKELGDLIGTLRRAAARCGEHSQLFANIGDDPEALVQAANALSADHPDKLVDNSLMLATLDRLIEVSSDAAAGELMVVRAKIANFSFGTAHIHLRINAAQIGTIIRRDLGLDTEDREPGRLVMRALARMASDRSRREVSFADLYLEHSTAHRQFMLCAQILKHIDSQAPIRFLIAEAENPTTVMAALYLARLYGVEDKVDISPLFETPDALESGGRFIRTLLMEERYCDYIRLRGRLCVQLGFSDSGRFIGQIAANMAIERIHNLILTAMRDRKLDAEIVFFNTHGESMGRGACPAGLDSRFNLLLTSWVRRQAEQHNQIIRHEVSFQGGDGFLHFASPELAESTIAAFCHSQLQPNDPKPDSFYSDGVFVWDFYRHLRRWHEDLFAHADYARLLGHFADGFQLRAGSRPVRRHGSDNAAGLRAISHNAILQQLGMPLNTACGIGSAMQKEIDELVSMVNNSERMRDLISYAFAARGLSSIPVLRAYVFVYDPGLWVSMAGGKHTDAYYRLAAIFSDCETSGSISRMANLLAIDLHKFDGLLAQLDHAPSTQRRREDRLDLHVLHAIRIAIMMRAFVLAGSLRAFSPRHDIGLGETTRLITGLSIDEAILRLNKVFPKSAEGGGLLNAITEPGHHRLSPLGYARFHEEIIDPLIEINAILHQLKTVISHAYGAYG